MQYFNSGFITHRTRKIGIIWNGQNAEHVMDEHLQKPTLHPFTHIKIQQLAKRVVAWEKVKAARHKGTVADNEAGVTIQIVADIYPKFALLITAIKKEATI